VPSYTPGFIDVYRNGALLGSADFTATNGTTVVLNNAASEGDLVETVSFLVSSVINAIPAVAGAVTSSYLLDASVTQAKLASGVAGNGPAFSATGTGQSFSASVWTKIQFTTEQFDTASCYDNTTNYRFTPNVAGYYYVTVSAGHGGSNNIVLGAIYKNGTYYQYATAPSLNAAYDPVACVSAIIYLNGSTDYVEGFINSNANLSTQNCRFSGAMARAA
jgi:hypothetical protein